MDEIKIEESPKIPSEITNSANLEKLCIFMGAGCSQLLDCPSWESLAKELVNSCYDCQELDFDFQDSKVLLDTQSPKEIITICKNLLSEKGLENRFENKIRESLKYNLATEDLDYNIYKKLTRLSKRNITFVTTNVDNHFSRFPEIDVEFENFTNYRPNTLYCIHGHIQKPESMIFTVKDYLNKYKDPGFTKFLQNIFENKTVLFLGYGLNELEVLDFLISKGQELTTLQEKNHFILLPFFKNQKKLLRFKKLYYESLGVEVIPYSYDEKGFKQLYHIIDNWCESFELETLPSLHNQGDNILDLM